MHGWLPYAIAAAVLLVLAPLAALTGKRYGRSIKGGLVLGSILLGFGYAIDPPAKQAIEAAHKDADKKGPQPAGDPPPE
jgi:hypothetical protein